ncbi:MAG: MBL fold metallo-hydrolase [Endomicrobium sp.]|nr:MBL fold metallo-hydrolase [Endomicrobium sp.]
MKKIQQSPNYKNGRFQNLSITSQMTSGKNIFATFWDLRSKTSKRLKPKNEIPCVKTDLLNLDKNENVLIWFGHSSLFIQTGGKRFLIDPVFEKPASPVFFFNRPFKGAQGCSVKDIPEIDYLIISHDHWDHLDYKTALALKDKLSKVICGLGVGAHFERWGYQKDKLIELDWNEEAVLDDKFKVYCLPARHFSGRGIKRDQSLWASFLIESKDYKFYIGGDSGYDSFYKEIGMKFGPIDLAALDCGQYNYAWKYIHMTPEETARAAKDLNAKNLIPVHSSKYALSMHAWDEPLKRVSQAVKSVPEYISVRLITPVIGEKVRLKDETQKFKEWWTEVE